MLSHPLAVRSARHAALSGRSKLRRNFFRPVSFETIFAFAALQCGIGLSLHLSPLVRSEDLAKSFARWRLSARPAQSSYISGALERLAVGRVARAFAKRFGVLLP
jgi:hypothetical protein